MKCLECNGTGTSTSMNAALYFVTKVPVPESHRCPTCNGLGDVTKAVADRYAAGSNVVGTLVLLALLVTAGWFIYWLLSGW